MDRWIHEVIIIIQIKYVTICNYLHFQSLHHKSKHDHFRQVLDLYTHCNMATFTPTKLFYESTHLIQASCMYHFSLSCILAQQLKLRLIQKGLGTSTTSINNWVEGSKATRLFCVACRGCKWIYSLLCIVWLRFLLRLSKNSMSNYKSLVNCLIQLW